MKKFTDTSWDRTSDLPICSTAPWSPARVVRNVQSEFSEELSTRTSTKTVSKTVLKINLPSRDHNGNKFQCYL